MPGGRTRARTVLLALFCVSLMVASSLLCVAYGMGSDTVSSCDSDSDYCCDDNGKTKFYVDHIKYIVNSDGKSVRVDGQNLGHGAAITIPDEVEYKGKRYLVTEIAKGAFCPKGNIHYCVSDVTIGSNVEVIHEAAFGETKEHHLEKVTFSEGSKLRTIGECAFSNSRHISSIVLPSSIEKIGVEAFGACVNLKKVTILPGDHGFTIEDKAFASCFMLESINLEHATKIGMDAFTNCGLTDLNLSSVKEIYKEAFEGCYKIKHVVFGVDFGHVSGSSFEVNFFDSEGNQITVGDPTLDKLRGKEFKGSGDRNLHEVVHPSMFRFT